MKGIIGASCYPRQSSLLSTIKIENMSREVNEGVMMRFKTITENFSTIVHLLVEPIISLAKPKAYVEASISIRKIP